MQLFLARQELAGLARRRGVRNADALISRLQISPCLKLSDRGFQLAEIESILDG
jgi:hypothetical protein